LLNPVFEIQMENAVPVAAPFQVEAGTRHGRVFGFADAGTNDYELGFYYGCVERGLNGLELARKSDLPK
jgi:hypothetical protein